MFSCQNCDERFMKIEDYNKHQYKHRDSSELIIQCLYPTCESKCTSYLSFNRHLKRFHRNDNVQLSCKYKNCHYVAPNTTLLEEHYKILIDEQIGAISCPHCSLEKKHSGAKMLIICIFLDIIRTKKQFVPM